MSPVTAWEMALGTGSNVLRYWFWNRYQTETKSGRLRHRVFNRCPRPPLVPGQGFTRYQNIHAKYPCAGIRTHDLLPHTLLLYHLTYAAVVIEKEISSFWSNSWMSLRYWLVLPPSTNVKVTTRYLRLIHRFHPPPKYRYEDESVGGPLVCFLVVCASRRLFGDVPKMWSQTIQTKDQRDADPWMII